MQAGSDLSGGLDRMGNEEMNLTYMARTIVKSPDFPALKKGIRIIERGKNF